ncbi:hypothetical protein ONZ45_g19330 [Pleurotus djamor]|nr:hypothetical protein ONZ45_g19330 [Pleurotus djamor]
MIKERRFNVHPNVLTCLLSLRLTTELGVRASDTKVSSDSNVKRSKKEKKGDKPHLSKKAKKMLKERNEIEREFRDAEAEVDKEERASTQTETLKLVFVLYFRILKNDRPTPLLPAALRGISRFSHLVNIDFFKDLMQVLKNLILREDGEGQNTSGLELASTFPAHHKVQHNLLCIITAFELLSGQGEALNLDLGEFTNCLYTEISTLSTINDIEATSPSLLVHSHHSHHRALESSLSDLLFRALALVFFSQNASSTPPWCSSAFGKRLLSGALHWPPRTVIKALQFVQRLVAKEPKLEALLTTDDRAFNGTYRPDINDPQACNPFGTAFWELILLSSHGDAGVRAETKKLMNYSQA